MSTSTYTVTGMTCGHCVEAVISELREVPGVAEVSVDLPSGRVEVTSERPIDAAAIRTAVEEAGFELVGAGESAR